MSRLWGAVAGGLVAGLGISEMLIAGERKTDKPSELAEIERAGAHRLGFHFPVNGTLTDSYEQAVIQGGYLALSAAAAYAAVTGRNSNLLLSGVGFGLAFYAAMHWMAGPALGLKKPEWQADKRTVGMHAFNHFVFGLVTALGAKLASR